MPVPRHLRVIALAFLLGGCGFFSPYRMEIQQGNFISRELMSQVKVGMTKDQVRAILGTPLVTDIFHADRWDYVFTRTAVNSSRLESRKASLLFKENVLRNIEADLMPPESERPRGQVLIRP